MAYDEVTVKRSSHHNKLNQHLLLKRIERQVDEIKTTLTMKYLSFSYEITFVALLFILFSSTNLVGQQNGLSESPIFKAKVSAKILSANKLVLVIDVSVPEGWQLKVATGYESMWIKKRDTIDLALKFLESSDYQMVERLKSSRKPVSPGYYYEEVTFVQTLRINNKKLPLFIDAKLMLLFVHKNGGAVVKSVTPCLFEVCKERAFSRTLRVGWGKSKREKVYLEDIVN
jgi:hypothetical protein